MDFLEKLFGFAPDGGDGSFEFLLFALPLAGIAVLGWWRRRSRAERNRQENQ